MPERPSELNEELLRDLGAIRPDRDGAMTVSRRSPDGEVADVLRRLHDVQAAAYQQAAALSRVFGRPALVELVDHEERGTSELIWLARAVVELDSHHRGVIGSLRERLLARGREADRYRDALVDLAGLVDGNYSRARRPPPAELVEAKRLLSDYEAPF